MLYRYRVSVLRMWRESADEVGLLKCWAILKERDGYITLFFSSLWSVVQGRA